EQLHDKVLYADADMNKADWLTAAGSIVGILGIVDLGQLHPEPAVRRADGVLATCLRARTHDRQVRRPVGLRRHQLGRLAGLV
ncbi:MAG TPA: hypothetical protein PLK46_15340, partial [Propioniciclava sp.]|uniref:hypothetical protein n=1 Tax=Propioniciclava sp. TaxID=2038686 RepID=UPI002B5D9019